MSQRSFQTALSRLVVDRGYRQRVRRRGISALAGDLSERERHRLVAVATSPGLDITRTLYHAWRLTKVLSLLPLTSALLGEKRLARELERFWEEQPARTLYFVEECLSFSNHLARRMEEGLDVPYLVDVLAYERAKLELRQSRANGVGRPTCQVLLHHDPDILLGAVSGGSRPREVPAGSFLLIGTLDPEGAEQWEVIRGMEGADPAVLSQGPLTDPDPRALASDSISIPAGAKKS